MFGTWEPEDEDDTRPMRRAAVRPPPESLAPITCDPPHTRASQPTFIIRRAPARTRLVWPLIVGLVVAPAILGAAVATAVVRRAPAPRAAATHTCWAR